MQDIGSGEDGEMNPVSKYEEHIETGCLGVSRSCNCGRHSSLAAHKETHFWLQVRNAGLAACEPWAQLGVVLFEHLL